jgi:HD-GYP domain-containing protein (c-di-GMP phosphodiesterase class II)
MERIRLRVWLLAAELAIAPVLIYALLSGSPLGKRAVGTGAYHFYIVSAVAALALLLALAVIWAARTLPDARIFFLAAGFLAMSGVFLAHGLGTAPFLGSHAAHAPADVAAPPPAATVDPNDPFAIFKSAATNGALFAPATTSSAQADDDDSGYGGYGGYGPPASSAQHGAGQPASPGERAAMQTTIARGLVVGFSGRLSLLLSALCFALTTLTLPEWLSAWIVRHWWRLIAAVIAGLFIYVPVAVLFPNTLTWVPMSSQALAWSVASITWAALIVAGWRFLQSFRLAVLPLQGAMALAMVLLCEANWFQLRGTVWTLPWWEYHVVMLAGFLLAVVGLLWQYRVAGDLGVVVEGLYLRDRINGLRDGDPRALTDLAVAVAAKDTETGAHIERVGGLVVEMGRLLGLDESRLELLRWAGRLHDLGKIGVPNAILRKPGKLTDAEFAMMKLHAPRGGNIAERSRLIAAAAPIIRAHHERMNGSGYPDGLADEQIPIESRLIAVADVWDALTCDRPYRTAMTEEDAALIIWKESGPLLDPRCVTALFNVLDARTLAA